MYFRLSRGRPIGNALPEDDGEELVVHGVSFLFVDPGNYVRIGFVDKEFAKLASAITGWELDEGFIGFNGTEWPICYDLEYSDWEVGEN
jgi:hypothetical protein